ncbi:MAG: hypothetical protein AAF609_05120 [Cyanobacteria bacterium P01_C01_bin.120]
MQDIKSVTRLYGQSMRSRFLSDFWHSVPTRWQRSVISGTVIGLCLMGLAACDRPPARSDTAQSSTATFPAAPPEATAESLPAAPPPPPDAAFLALITPEKTAQIRDLGLPLVLPAAVPAGFQVAQVQTQADERFGGYQILYRDDRDRCFLIEYTVGGIGDMPATENRLPLSPPMLAEDSVEYGLNYGVYVDPALREQFPESLLHSDWLPVAGGFSRLAGAALINEMLTPAAPCTNLPVADAVAIIDSLAVITDEIQGDDSP